MRKALTTVLFLTALCGCSSTARIDVPRSGITVIDYAGDRRGSYLVKGKDDRCFILSEPSPDVAREITGSLQLSAATIAKVADPNLKAAYASQVIDLANRSQTLQVLRESLFRLAEMGVNSDIETQERIALFKEILATTRIIAATEFIKQAPPETADEMLKQVLSEVGTGTIPIPQ